MLLTRAPLYSWYCYHFLVRLACVRHAASVDSEPGSNSRLKPDASPQPTEVGEVQLRRALERRDAYFVRMIKPNLISSHNWHVQPDCQRSLRLSAWAGPFWIEARPFGRLVLELVALPDSRFRTVSGIFARTFQTYQTSGCRSRQTRPSPAVQNPAQRKISKNDRISSR